MADEPDISLERMSNVDQMGAAASGEKGEWCEECQAFISEDFSRVTWYWPDPEEAKREPLPIDWEGLGYTELGYIDASKPPETFKAPSGCEPMFVAFDEVRLTQDPLPLDWEKVVYTDTEKSPEALKAPGYEDEVWCQACQDWWPIESAHGASILAATEEEADSERDLWIFNRAMEMKEKLAFDFDFDYLLRVAEMEWEEEHAAEQTD